MTSHKSSHQPVGRGLALIDFYVHTRGGHFGEMLKWYADQFASRLDQLFIFTPDPSLTKKLFQRPSENVSFHRLPSSSEKSTNMNDVLANAKRIGSGCRMAAFFMWGIDLFILSKYCSEASPLAWSTFGTFSRALRDKESKMAKYESLTLEFFDAHPNCVAIAQPDRFLEKASPKFVTIIDRFEPFLPLTRSPLRRRMEEFGNGTVLIGSVGNLYGFRAVHEIQNLAILHPNLRFILAGKLSESSMHPQYLAALQNHTQPNLLFLPGHIEEDAAFNDAIAALDAVLVDGRTYPHQSGVCCKALALGKYLLSPSSNSWMTDVITQYGVGDSYSDPRHNILEAWQKWKETGGPERSKNAILEVCNPSQNKQALDCLCARLLPQ